MKWFVIALLCSICQVLAVSDADPNYVYLCDALSPLWGCQPQFWVGGNRLACSNTSQIMNWATSPTRSDCYRIVAGKDENNTVTSYTPNEYINIHIRVTCWKKLYRGLLIYAVDNSETKVGEWEFPIYDPPVFKKPWGTQTTHPCYRTVMHASAMYKPYHSVLHFKAPPVGTGRIRFRCLIKVSFLAKRKKFAL